MPAFLLLVVVFFSSVFSVVDEASLKIIEQFLSSMNTLEADMTMDICSGEKNSVSEYFEGKIWLDRHHGFLRINYGKNVMIAREGMLFIDQENQEVQKIETENTPAGILLKPTINFKEEKFIVKSLTKRNDLWQLFLFYDSPIGQIPVTLYFKPLPVMILLGWTIQNPDGSVTNVHLNPEKTHMAIDIDASIFQMK